MCERRGLGALNCLFHERVCRSAIMRDRNRESGRPTEIVLNFKRDVEGYVVLKTKLYSVNTNFMYFYLRGLKP